MSETQKRGGKRGESGAMVDAWSERKKSSFVSESTRIGSVWFVFN